MTDLLWFIAFVATPACVVIGAYVAMRLHERSLDKKYRVKPGE